MKNLLLLIYFLFNIATVNAQCVDNGNYWNNSWSSCKKSANPNPANSNSFWLMYEFHKIHTLDSTRIWNANRQEETTSGMNKVIIEYTIDTTDEWTLLGTYDFPQADGSSTYQGFEGPTSYDGLYISKPSR